MEARANMHKGTTVHVTTDPARVHVFDTGSGARLSA
jgi:multiple sugar transport system ATP-binding protein